MTQRTQRREGPAGGRRHTTNRPTLDQVAARAGVGRGTVSRVVNGSPQVSDSARVAVEEAIRELGYVPNRAARALVTQRADSVALVVAETEERGFGDPFIASIIRGVNSQLLQTNLHLWLAMTRTDRDRDWIGKHLTPQHIDGVLLLSLHNDDPLPRVLAERGMPVVQCGQPGSGVKIVGDQMSCVDVDNLGGAQQAVTHLIGQDRTRIGAIAGPQELGAAAGRLAGYRRALEVAGLPIDESLIEYTEFTEDGGAGAMRALLDRHPNVDAVFASSDAMAAGTMRVLREYGRRVPVDVAVAGFDDSVLARLVDPPLTTVHQPVEAMGREMANLLVEHIRGEQRPAPLVVLDTRLVIRGTA